MNNVEKIFVIVVDNDYPYFISEEQYANILPQWTDRRDVVVNGVDIQSKEEFNVKCNKIQKMMGFNEFADYMETKKGNVKCKYGNWHTKFETCYCWQDKSQDKQLINIQDTLMLSGKTSEDIQVKNPQGLKHLAGILNELKILPDTRYNEILEKYKEETTTNINPPKKSFNSHFEIVKYCFSKYLNIHLNDNIVNQNLSTEVIEEMAKIRYNKMSPRDLTLLVFQCISSLNCVPHYVFDIPNLYYFVNHLHSIVECNETDLIIFGHRFNNIGVLLEDEIKTTTTEQEAMYNNATTPESYVLLTLKNKREYIIDNKTANDIEKKVQEVIVRGISILQDDIGSLDRDKFAIAKKEEPKQEEQPKKRKWQTKYDYENIPV